MAKFPAVRTRRLLALLMREPLNYQVVRQSGSHRVPRADGRPQLVFSAHDGDTVPPGLVRKIPCRDIGLSESDALDLL